MLSQSELMEKLYNSELRADTVFGAFPCELYGEQDSSDKMYAKIKLPGGEVAFARMCFTFPLVATPSKAWLKAYSNSIYAWVVFERGLPERPIIIGFTFKEGKEHSSDSYPDVATLIGEKYQITIDDAKDRLELIQLSGNKQEIVIEKDKVYIKSDNINLGDVAASEPSVLGDTLEGLLNDFLDAVMQGKVTTSLGPMTFMPDTLAKLGQIKSKVSTIKSTINKIS